MNLVVDASTVVAALSDSGSDGIWARELLADGSLAAPHLMLAEAANILRRASAARILSNDVASLAYEDLLQLPVQLFSFAPFGDRIWELRKSFTVYDAWYVALAESLNAPLVTLDARLAKAWGSRCKFSIPK
ncbi:MAG: type II toxin-antitoxin system VapC family toxin [Actinomycetota bacterium]